MIQKYDVIVIGAGLGGLTAGAKLAKEGKKVLVIEQHDRPGGCATTFRRKDYTLEVGLHEMVGFNTKDLKTKIFNDLDVFNNVEFLEIPEFYRFVNKNHDIVIPHDADEATQVLTDRFPDDEKGIKDFFFRLTKLNQKKEIKESPEEISKNLGEYLDSIIQDEDLKLILLGNLGYYHDDPYSLSLNYYTAAQGEFYKGGGVFVKGGSQMLSNYLSEFIQKNGGDVKLKHIATEIIIENNKAVGVLYKKVSKKETEIFRADAKDIVANTAIPNLANDLLPPEYGTELMNSVEELKNGASLLTVYYGFKKPVKELGNKNYSVFIYDDSIETQADILENNKSDFTTRSFTFVDYSQVDSGLAPEGKSVGVVCCIDYLSDWENLEKKEYDAKKRRVAQIFTERLEKIIPGIKNEIEYCGVGTSKTVKRYTMNPGGSVYGFAQLPQENTVKNAKTVENLHFASAWSTFGGGIYGAIYSGYFCSFGILRKKN